MGRVKQLPGNINRLETFIELGDLQTWLAHCGRTKSSITVMAANMRSWIPTPGIMATYVGRTRAQTRNVIVIAEAVRGRMVVEAIGKKGINVRLTVNARNLREPQPDLFG